MSISKVARVYNTFGQYYHDSRTSSDGRVHNEYIDMPATFSLLPKRLKGLKILDAGCGSGIYACALAKKGAAVTGIDVSRQMIVIAKKETPTNLDVSYRVGDIAHVGGKNASFDLILSTYVLENVTDLEKVFKEFYRVLKRGGSCIFSISHPFRSKVTKVEKNGREVWILDDYFKPGTRQADFGHGMVVPKVTRTLQEYSSAAVRAGFLIADLLEPQPLPTAKKVDRKKFETTMRLPQILTFKLVKL